MSDTGARSRGFEVGRVISGTFGVIGRNFLPFIALAVLLGGLPRLALFLTQVRFVGGAQDGSNLSPAMIGAWGASGLVTLIGALVLQGTLVHATVADLDGRRAPIGDSLKTGLRQCLPLLGLGILLGLGVVLGTILLIVPGVILVVMWSAAVPAKVVEKIGVTEAFSRSGDLTRGRRWPVFGLLLIYVVAGWIVEMVIMAAVSPFTLFKNLSFSSGSAEGLMQSMNGMQMVATPIIATLTALFSTVGAAVLYFELRGSREGVGAEALASVFE